MVNSVSTPRVKAYYARLRVRLVALLGGCCKICGALAPLEFAHLLPTAIHGRGRGSFRRLRDVRDNWTAYCLLCADCHDVFDGRGVRTRASAQQIAGRVIERGPESVGDMNVVQMAAVIVSVMGAENKSEGGNGA